MRKIFILFAVFYCNIAFGQAIYKDNSINIHPLVGLRIHNASGYLGGTSFSEKHILTSPVFGIEVTKGASPISFSWQVDFNLALPSGSIDSTNHWASHVLKSTLEHQFQVYYKLKKCTLGLGYYWRRDENLLTHASSDFFVTGSSGIQTAVSLPFSWLDIEWRYKANITPVGAILGWSQQSIVLLYHIQKQPKKSVFKSVEVNTFLGSRFFDTRRIERVPGEHFNAIGISPSFCLEVYYPKWRISFNAEKDWYYSFNGGSQYRDIKAEIKTSFLSLGCHLPIDNQHRLKVKIGLAFIQDSDLSKDFTIYTPNLSKRIIYSAKGIGAAVSYNLFKNADLEVRHIFPWIGDELFSPTRFSLGLMFHRKSIKI